MPRRVGVLVTAGAVVVASALVAVALLARPGAHTAAATTVAAPPSSAYPTPPKGAIVYGRALGSDALALGVVPQGKRMLVQASVLGQQGEGVSGLTVRFAAAGASRTGLPCGAGCYRATLPVDGRPASVRVGVRGSSWVVPLPAVWPPADASALVARAGRVWRSLDSLGFDESLASGPTHRTISTWRVHAPDRLAYTIKDGWSGIVIGAHRWDRSPNGDAWVRSPQTPLTQPVPPWAAVTDAHVLGTVRFRGRRAWRISFFDPRSHAWFTIVLDRATLHTLDLRMVTTAHFMHDVYGSFNAAPPVRPPS